MDKELRIGWTTVDSLEAAEKLARAFVQEGLAACVQIESLVGSVYRWEGGIRQDAEWRLAVKFAANKSAQLESYLLDHHPYNCPQWIVVCPEQVSAGYLKWATGQ